MTFTPEELKRKRVGVLSGGMTKEREPSLVAGNCVTEGLRSLGYDVCHIDVGLDVAKRVAEERLEVAFIALLGGWGEDGSIQGLLESMSIPYTGSGILATAIAHDKLFSKYIFGSNGVPIAPWITVPKDAKVTVSELPFGLPCVVKPSREGSSVGVHIVRTPEELAHAVEAIREYWGVPVIEKYIEGKEVCVGVVAERLLGTIEIVPLREFYDFTAKYVPGNAEYHVPARLSRARIDEIVDVTFRAYRALGCSGTARADLRVPEVGEAVILEMNPSPGMSTRSLMAKMAAHEGTDYPALCERILLAASLKA